MKTIILLLASIPALILAPAKTYAIENGYAGKRSKVAKVNKKKNKTRAIRSKATGRASARIVKAVRVRVKSGKVVLSAKGRAKKRVNANNSVIFDLQ